MWCKEHVKSKCKCKYNVSTLSSVSVRPVNKIDSTKRKTNEPITTLTAKNESQSELGTKCMQPASSAGEGRENVRKLVSLV